MDAREVLTVEDAKKCVREHLHADDLRFKGGHKSPNGFWVVVTEYNEKYCVTRDRRVVKPED